MANDRMYFLHVDSGYVVYMGKRMGWGWYGVPSELPHLIQHIHEMVEYQIAEGGQDAYEIAFEGDPRVKFIVWDTDHHQPLSESSGAGGIREVPWTS